MNNYGLLCIIYLTFGAFFYGYDSGLTTSVIGYPGVRLARPFFRPLVFFFDVPNLG